MYGKLLDRSRKLVEHRLDEKLKAQRHAVDRIVRRYHDLATVLLGWINGNYAVTLDGPDEHERGIIVPSHPLKTAVRRPP